MREANDHFSDDPDGKSPLALPTYQAIDADFLFREARIEQLYTRGQKLAEERGLG